MLNITIKNIRVESISNLGSLNIGKSIVCHNSVSDVEVTSPEQLPSMAQLETTIPPPSVPPIAQITPTTPTTPVTPATPITQRS